MRHPSKSPSNFKKQQVQNGTEPKAPAKDKKPTKPTPFQIWLTAARPHTLTASLCPNFVAYAVSSTPVSWHLWWSIFCMTVQLGTNLHNDYADAILGADTDERVGHKRATAQGWLTPNETLHAAYGVLSVSLITGVVLLVQADQLSNPFLWFLVLTSIFNAFAYTGGPVPLGYIGLGNGFSIAYNGWGDVFCMAYFGWVATLMVPYLGQLSSSFETTSLPWTAATQVGALATNILIVNNLRDANTDVKANKRTTTVRFGRTFSLTEYAVLLLGSYGACVLQGSWLPLLTLPLAWREWQAVSTKQGSALNAHVGGAAKLQLAFCLMLSLNSVLAL